MKSEIVYIGLAVDKIEIFKLQFEEENMTIHDYLKKTGLHNCHCR